MLHSDAERRPGSTYQPNGMEGDTAPNLEAVNPLPTPLEQLAALQRLLKLSPSLGVLGNTRGRMKCDF